MSLQIHGNMTRFQLKSLEFIHNSVKINLSNLLTNAMIRRNVMLTKKLISSRKAHKGNKTRLIKLTSIILIFKSGW